MALKDDKVFGEMLEALAQHLMRRLHDLGGFCETCKRSGPTAAELSVIRQLLHDNGITAAPKRGAIHKLADHLPFEDGEATKQAHQ